MKAKSHKKLNQNEGTFRHAKPSLRDRVNHILINKILLQFRYAFRKHKVIVLSIILFEALLRNSHVIK